MTTTVRGPADRNGVPSDNRGNPENGREAPPVRADGEATVLVVDDDVHIRQILSRALAYYGYRVTTAESGRAAIAAMEREMPDVLLTDIVMPDGDGIEIIRRVNESHPGLAVIGMSGDCDHGTDLLKFARMLGAAAVLKKPITLRDLDAVIRQHLPAASDEAQIGG